jgi:superfamily II RNA helicase
LVLQQSAAMTPGRAHQSLAFAFFLCKPLTLRVGVRHGAFLPLRAVSRGQLDRASTACGSPPARSYAAVPASPVSALAGASSSSSASSPKASAAAASSATAAIAAAGRAEQAHIARVAGAPEAVDRVRALFAEHAAARTLTPKLQNEVVAACFPFVLDRFQTDALQALGEAKNVILSAPTGSGKTVVGEMAIVLALARQLRVFYTTPLKALSNQKFFDFKKLFGDDRVGLLTGDVAVNREAPIVVMTTEVYRNMLYADSSPGAGDMGRLVTDDVFAVVFDEFHYLNDAERGTVWEESVVNSPSHVLLVALSATMANADDVRDWFTDVQGPTTLIESDHRPVPLKFSFCQREGLVPLFADASKISSSSSSSSKSKRKKNKGVGSSQKEKLAPRSSKPKLHPLLIASLTNEDNANTRGRAGSWSSRRQRGKGPADEREEWAADRGSRGDLRRRRRRDHVVPVPSYAFVVRSLRRRDMLPAIVFIFSRNGCDRAAAEAASEREALVSDEESNKIGQYLAAFAEQHPDLVQQDRIDLAMQGICSHHAGLLPLWKACVEELFQAGLIKVVFATETLAAGINMPARTTVISALSKRFGSSRTVQLTTSEVLQMAGRAGRRGKDTIGYSVMMQSRNEGPLEAFRVVTSDVDSLCSHFSTTYGMALNLVQTRSFDDARSLVERSFGSFLRRKRLSLDSKLASNSCGADRSTDLQMSDSGDSPISGLGSAPDVSGALDSVIEEARKIAASVDEANLASYVKAVERVKAERRALSYVVRQSRETDAQLVEDSLAFAPAGMRIQLRGQRLSGKSRGALRRRKRREVSAAFAAVVDGDQGAELRALLHSEDPLEEIDDAEMDAGDVHAFSSVAGSLDEQGNPCELLDAILLDAGQELGMSMLFSAVCHDGKLCFFNYQHVERVFFAVEPVDIDSILPDWHCVEFPERSNWIGVSADQYFAPLPEEFQILADEALNWRNERSLVNAGSSLAHGSLRLGDIQTVEHSDASVGGSDQYSGDSNRVEKEEILSALEREKEQHPEVHAQRERLEYARSLVRNHHLHAQSTTRAAIRAKNLIPVLEALRPDLAKGKRRLGHRSRSQKAVELNSTTEVVTPDGSDEQDGDGTIFEYFKKIVSVLQQYGFVDQRHCVTSLGELGAKIRSENELWTSIVLLEPRLQDVSPVHLAAVVGAILAEGSRQDTYVGYLPSPEVSELASCLAPLRSRLLDIQEVEGVGIPVYLDIEQVGLIEAWAQGESWVDMLSNTSLQEGDVCRILRRVLDQLRQIPHLPLVTDSLKLNAKRSVALLDRFPVVDDRTYVVNEHERMYNKANARSRLEDLPQI